MTDPALAQSAARLAQRLNGGLDGGLDGGAAASEALGRLSDAAAAAIADSDLARMLVPRDLGGAEAEPADFFDVIEAVARSDAAAAWCTMIGATSGLVAAYLPTAAARSLFDRPGLMLAGVYAPRGRARRLAGGPWHVSGRWAWGSGAHHAQHFVVGCLEQDVATPRVLSAVVPRSAVRVLGNWASVGLRGTGSGEFEIDGVEVAADQVACIAADVPPARPLYRFPLFGLLALGIAAVSCGLARAALDAFVSHAQAKQPQGSRRTLAERATVQEALARSEASSRAARAGVQAAVALAWAAAQAGAPLSLEVRRDLRLACTHASHDAAAVCNRLWALAGGDVIFDGSALQRAWRDAHVATQHLMVAEPTWELAGRSLFGQTVDGAQY